MSLYRRRMMMGGGMKPLHIYEKGAEAFENAGEVRMKTFSDEWKEPSEVNLKFLDEYVSVLAATLRIEVPLKNGYRKLFVAAYIPDAENANYAGNIGWSTEESAPEEGKDVLSEAEEVFEFDISKRDKTEEKIFVFLRGYVFGMYITGIRFE